MIGKIKGVTLFSTFHPHLTLDKVITIAQLSSANNTAFLTGGVRVDSWAVAGRKSGKSMTKFCAVPTNSMAPMEHV